MIVRTSIISLFLASNFLSGMEIELEKRPYQSLATEFEEIDINSETTGKTNYITSLQSWQEFAKNNELLGDYEVSPEAVAQFQQVYEIKTDLSVLPEVVAIWSRHQSNPKYNAEVARMQVLLRGSSDVQDKQELNALCNLCIKNAYNQLQKRKQTLVGEQKYFSDMRTRGIALPVIAGVLGIAWIIELVVLIMYKDCPY